jgi:hypothetical protein
MHIIFFLIKKNSSPAPSLEKRRGAEKDIFSKMFPPLLPGEGVRG